MKVLTNSRAAFAGALALSIGAGFHPIAQAATITYDAFTSFNEATIIAEKSPVDSSLTVREGSIIDQFTSNPASFTHTFSAAAALPLFDPSLGTLTNITLRAQVGDGGAPNPSVFNIIVNSSASDQEAGELASANGSVTRHFSFAVGLLNESVPFDPVNLSASCELQDLIGSASCQGVGQETDMLVEIGSIIQPSTYANFLGVGSFDVGYRMLFSLDLGTLLSEETFRQAFLFGSPNHQTRYVVSYEYTPAGSEIPEPMSLALLGTAFIALRLSQGRRRTPI